MTSKVEMFGGALGKAIRRTTAKIREGQFGDGPAPSDHGEARVNAWDDPRIARGMARQLEQRRARIAAGETPLGWKVGLGAKGAMERLGITMPLVGYMMQKSLLPNGSAASVAGWTQPVAEPETASEAVEKPA